MFSAYLHKNKVDTQDIIIIIFINLEAFITMIKNKLKLIVIDLS